MAAATTIELDEKLAADGLRTGGRYVLRRPAADDLKLRVRLHDGRYQPCGGVAFTLSTEDGLSFQGTTDGDGFLAQAVPKGTKQIRVTYQPKGDEEIALDLAVPPADAKDDDAYLAHLRNLGFGDEGEAALRVILRFQGTHRELVASGELDEKTKKALDAILDGTRFKVSGS